MRSCRGSRRATIPAGSPPGPTQIIKMLELPPAEAARRAKEIGAAEAQRGSSRGGVNPFPVFFMVIIFFVVIGSIARRAGGRRYKRPAARRRDRPAGHPVGARRDQPLGRRWRRLGRRRRRLWRRRRLLGRRRVVRRRRRFGGMVMRSLNAEDHAKVSAGDRRGRSEQRRRDRRHRERPVGRLSRRRAALCGAGGCSRCWPCSRRRRSC